MIRNRQENVVGGQKRGHPSEKKQKENRERIRVRKGFPSIHGNKGSVDGKSRVNHIASKCQKHDVTPRKNMTSQAKQRYEVEPQYKCGPLKKSKPIEGCRKKKQGPARVVRRETTGGNGHPQRVGKKGMTKEPQQEETREQKRG